MLPNIIKQVVETDNNTSPEPSEFANTINSALAIINDNVLPSYEMCAVYSLLLLFFSSFFFRCSRHVMVGMRANCP